MAAQRSYWDRNGPPLNIAVLVIGQTLGVKWDAGDKSEPIIGTPTEGPSIADIAASITMPMPRGDTMAASRDVLRAMGGG